MQRTQSFLLRYRAAAGEAAVGEASIHPASAFGNQLSLVGRRAKGPSMTIKFEGKPPFYLGIAEVASAHALDGERGRASYDLCPCVATKVRPGAVPRGDGRCQSIGGAVADCRENGRASKAARRLELFVFGTPLNWRSMQSRQAGKVYVASGVQKTISRANPGDTAC